MPDFFKKMKKKVDKKKMTSGDRMGSKETAPRRLKFLPLHASTTSIFCRRKREDSSQSNGENSQKSQVFTLLVFHISQCYLSFFHWRVETQEESQQEEKTAAPQGSADQEAEDQTAHQGENATSQSFHHRSVRRLYLCDTSCRMCALITFSIS